MSLQGGGAHEWREGLGRHRWVHCLEALCSVQDDWEEIPRAPSSPVTWDSVCDSCVPFTVPVQSKALQSPPQSCPQARRKLLGLEQNRRQDLSFLTLSLQPFLHPFAPRPLSYRISLCPPFPRRQSSKRVGSPLNSCNIYCRNKEWGQRGFWSQLEMKDNRRLTGKLGLVL